MRYKELLRQLPRSDMAMTPLHVSKSKSGKGLPLPSYESAILVAALWGVNDGAARAGRYPPDIGRQAKIRPARRRTLRWGRIQSAQRRRLGSFWSFPEPPPTKHLSWVALAVMPAMLVAIILEILLRLWFR